MSLRIARWAVRLMAFTFEVKYKKGCENVIPDFCSRFPRSETVNEMIQEEDDEELINTLLEDRDLTDKINSESVKCTEVAGICKFVTDGWPRKKELTETNKKYYLVREELTVHNNKLLRGERIVAL